ncbi:MAG: tRNA glutamyl-Q(34) synthetase GluQRS [Boseongicola sp.]|nr:MAG: tRNA glutamyl-Q(34) synthetase GluQRS [Boseongicola sp.]
MRTRFAPSPTGPLHIGHAFSALLNFQAVQNGSGEFLLRIEDIDQTRSRKSWESQIFRDLEWLGLSWTKPVMRQSERIECYQNALQSLWARGLLYPCSCKRKDILSAASAANEGTPLSGPDGTVYPGTCRSKDPHSTALPQGAALRLNIEAAFEAIADPATLAFQEEGAGPNQETGAVSMDKDQAVTEIGDIVLARRDFGTSYHLSVVVDDAAQEITNIIRGQDLFQATHIHVLLQRLLSLPTPIYRHHRLIRDENGKRLAKRDDARSIDSYRQSGASAAHIRELIGL